MDGPFIFRCPTSAGPSNAAAVGLTRTIKLRNSYINARKMRFVVGDRLATLRYVQSLWNAHPNGQQPFASHARMSLRKGLEKRRQHGLASSVSFQQIFGGASPRRRRRESDLPPDSWTILSWKILV